MEVNKSQLLGALTLGCSLLWSPVALAECRDALTAFAAQDRAELTYNASLSQCQSLAHGSFAKGAVMLAPVYELASQDNTAARHLVDLIIVEQGKVHRRLPQPLLFAPEAHVLSNVELDAIQNWQGLHTGSDSQILGLRTSVQVGEAGVSEEQKTLHLFLLQEASLRPILLNMPMERHFRRTENVANSESTRGFGSEIRTIFSIQPTQHHDFADIGVMRSVVYGDLVDGEWAVVIEDRATMELHYDGNRYVPQDLYDFNEQWRAEVRATLSQP
uniref:hypothetical protein n=1 Tax=Thaumasiovibrio occultus TaxID=1891184 RepID=UPI000B351ED9|nr:hypothetical protein [Thaumasiovibrio occultus]